MIKMIRLFDSTAVNFNTQGLGSISDYIKATVTEEINGVYELSLTYPIGGIHYNDIQLRRILFAKPTPYADPQPFRIYSISKPINKIVTINAAHISYDLTDYPVNEFSATSPQDAFAKLKSNAQVSHPFTFNSTVTGATGNVNVEGPRTTRSVLGNNILRAYGGEYEFDRYTVYHYNQRGMDRGYRISYGKNLLDVKQEENVNEVYTGVYPFWVGTDIETDKTTVVKLDNRIVNTPGTFNFTRILPLDLSTDFTNPPTKQQLLDKANAYISQNKIGTPKVSLELSFLQIGDTPIELGDTALVEFTEAGINSTARCIRTIYDVGKDRYESVSFGEGQSNLAVAMSNGNKAIIEKIDQQKQFFDAEVGNIKIDLAVIDTALINKADIDYLSANYARLLNGYIDTAQIKDASIGTAQIKDAEITVAKIETAFVDKLTATQGKFQSAHIGELTSDNITTDTILAEHIAAQVIDAINLNVTDKISADRIDVNSLVVDDIDAGKITTGTLDAERIKASVIEAINFSTDTATINSAKIGDIDASKITTGSLDADLITANVIAAINASVGKISADRLDVDSITVNNIDAGKITTGDLNAERIKAQVIAAINSYTGTAKIKQAQIETLQVGSANITDLDVSKLTGDKIDAKFIDTDNLEVDFANITGTLTADKIKGGTLDAKNMTVTNLNAASITVGQINGNQIASGAITKEKFDSVLSGEWNSVMNEVDDILEENGLIKEQVEVVQNEIDNLEIGGRNLLKDTLFDKTLNSTYYNQRGGVYSLTIDTENKHNNNNSLKIKSNAIGSSGTDVLIKTLGTPTAGSKYTLSFYAKSLEDTTLTARWGYGGISGTALISPEWKRYVIFIPSGAQIYQDIFIYFDKITEVFIATPKLEKGNKPTDWTPAPEDTVENIEAVEVIANSAQTSANTANNLLSDLSNDNKLTAVEKQDTKKEWDIIVSEKSKLEANATTYGITTEKTNYTNAYNTLNTYITPLLSSLNTTSDIVGTTFRTNFKNYYDRRQDLLNAITAKAKTLADTAQSSVNNLQIGGTNLVRFNSLKNLKSGSSTKEFVMNAWAHEIIDNENVLKMFKAGQKYTVSFDAEIIARATPPTLYSLQCGFVLYSRSNGNNSVSITARDMTAIGDKRRISATFTCPDITDQVMLAYTNRYTTNEESPIEFDTVRFTNFKIEKGDKATDWSLSPEDVTDTVDNVKVGGRNLMRNSRTISISSNNNTNYPITANLMTEGSRSFSRLTRQDPTTLGPTMFSIYNGIGLNDLTENIKSRQITLSFKARSSVRSTWTYMAYVYSGSTQTHLPMHNLEVKVDTEWSTYSVVIDMPSSVDGIRFIPSVLVNGGTYDLTTFYIDFCEWKIEFGNKPTDWSPAPEDVDSSISAAQSTANTASANATTANNLLADLANDNKLTAVEKQETKKEWDIIVSEKSKIDANANSYGITTELTNYTNAYNTLNTYITPLLSSLTTTSDIVGTTFRTNFKNYYDRRQELLNAITAKAKTLADNAQNSVNNLEIGGRNLLSNSIFNYPTNHAGWSYNSTYTNIDTTKTFNGHNTLKVSVSGLTADQWVGATSTGLSRRTFKAGETVTISCWYYVEDKTTITDRISIGIQGILGTETSAREFASGQIMLSNIVQGSWTKHSLTYTFPSDAKDVIYRCWVKRNGTAWFADFKFEMGSKATDWSPAPEDTNTQIQTVTSIANGKNTIYYATSAPSITGKKVDDIWFDTDDGNRIYRFTGSAWSAAQFGQNALAANSITANHIVSGTISAGKLAADSVVASNIAADAVVARNIKAGEVTAGKLAVNAVVAGNIAANAVTSDKINTKAITAEKLDVAEIWADSGFIQQFSATSIDATQITTGKISGDRIEMLGLISYEALDTDLQPLFDVTSGKTYINGGMLAANTIKANSIDLLSGITVTGPDNNITFAIEDNGEVTINGLMRSGNYDEEKKTGYRLTTDGKAILNNATVRGVVELPNAGMTNDYDMGQTEGRNLVLGTAVPTVVASVTDNNYQYASFEYGAKPNTTYTMSFNVKILTGSFTKLTVYGSYANNSGTVDIVNGRCVYTFTTPTTLDNGSTNPSIWKKALIYAGASGGTAGNSIEISKLKIEEGSTATDWTPAPEDNINPVRIWAGGSYELRDSAPFRVLQNGDVYATNATLSGILYGSVDSGSVHINDSHLTVVNDTVTPTVEYFYAGTEDVRVNTDFILGTPNSPRLSYSNDDRILSINDSTTVIDTNNINLTFNRSGGWSNAMVISSNLPTYNSTVSIGHAEGSWANSLLISHDGPKGTSYGDIVFRRRVWEENIEVQVQGDISVSNAIKSNKQSIEIRSISNEGWGFYAS